MVAVRPTHLCIISRDQLRGGHFLAVLQASLGPEDELEIIMDRRHGGSSGEPDLKEDRRRQHEVDLALEADGFAIVPASVDPTEDEPPIERLSPVDDEDEERLESIRSFERRRPGTLIPKLLGVLSGLTLAALVLSVSAQITGQSLLSPLFSGPLSGGPDEPPGRTNESSAVAQTPAATEEPVVAKTQPARIETPPPARPSSESPSAGETASTGSVSPRDLDRLTPRPRETSGPSETSTRGASPPASETGASSRAGTGQDASGGRSRAGATARQSPSAASLSNQVASALPPGAAMPNATPAQVVGPHRAELVGQPVSRRWGDSYAVRLLDPAGRPMVVAGVSLVARMADGTVENIAMGALPEPGTYRGTVPTGRSTPVDLRIRVTTGDESVEVPVSR